MICAGTTGYNLDFDVRHLWMRQKQIIGSHFANAYECMKANQLIEQGLIRPVLWRTLGFEGVPEAHQLMLENKHLGKISILVGATEAGQGKTVRRPRGHPRRGRGLAVAGVVHVDWYATVLRQDALAAEVVRAAPLALRYGATQYSVHRSNDDRYKIVQMAWFDSHEGLVSLLGGPGDDRVPAPQLGQVPDPGHIRLARGAGIAGALGPEVPL